MYNVNYIKIILVDLLFKPDFKYKRKIFFWQYYDEVGDRKKPVSVFLAATKPV